MRSGELVMCGELESSSTFTVKMRIQTLSLDTVFIDNSQDWLMKYTVGRQDEYSYKLQ